MKSRPFGQKSGVETSIIGQGTWNMGRADWKDSVSALRRGVDLGMTHIDTAEYYGAAENIVGEAIAGRRDEVFLVSKVMPQNASEKGTVKACEASLAKLATSHLDCYLLHWRGSKPLAETIAGFDRLLEQGKILSFGVSNFDVDDLEEVWALSEGRIVCNQVLYHLEERAIEHGVLPWCAAHGVAVTAYSPFGSGHFPGPATPGGQVLARIASARRATARQVALAFLTRETAVFAIPKASNAAHAEDNAAAGSLALSHEDIAALDAAFPKGSRRSLPMI
ncbi:aldo/keto reductase [soil metagenome]